MVKHEIFHNVTFSQGRPNSQKFVHLIEFRTQKFRMEEIVSLVMKKVQDKYDLQIKNSLRSRCEIL